MNIMQVDLRERRDVFFDDLSQRIAIIIDHPVDHIEPEDELGSIDDWKQRELAIAGGIINYIFSTGSLVDAFSRLICMAQRVVPHLLDVQKGVEIADLLGVSPQAFNQMAKRANKVISRKLNDGSNENSDHQLSLF
jgi:hypothetical protein